MTRPEYKITADGVRRLAEMFDIPMTDREIIEFSRDLAGGFAAIADLWDVDVAGIEPAAILPIDRRS